MKEDDRLPEYPRMMVAFDPIPGCDSVERLRDLWSHPLMQDKWAAVVKVTLTLLVFLQARIKKY